MIEKKKYYKATDDLGMWLITDNESDISDCFGEDFDLTIEEVWMTEEEYEALPEFEG